MEETKESEIPESNHPKFLEVTYKSTGKVGRFAHGTKARFAVDLMNYKLGPEVAEAVYIEAVKEGEEPISFGPDAVLVNYGQGWKLQTVTLEGRNEAKRVGGSISEPLNSSLKSPNNSAASSSSIRLLYIGKIFVAFAFMFLLGGLLTLFLENLPAFLLLLSSYFPGNELLSTV